MLRVEDIYTYYDKSNILQGVSLEVRPNEVVALLGRNGVGKTTTLKSIIGINHPRRGKVYFERGGMNVDITSLTPNKVVSLGIAYVPEDRRIFPRLSVSENLQIGIDLFFDDKPSKQAILERIFSYFPILKERLRQDGKNLSGGEQQMLAIARALTTKPSLILLDEPSEGLMPLFVNRIREIIQRLQEEGISILLVEQNAEMALGVSHRAYVMEKGNTQCTGAINDIKNNRLVLSRYLGVS
jgi:branched-chain amino acid transport system ATP-binding protein